MARDSLKEMLRRDEGVRAFVYDDANGCIIVPGSVVVGHPTIAVGRAADINGLSDSEIEFLLDNDVARCEKECAPFGWYNALDEVRQDVILSMCFNMGIHGLLGFKKMIEALEQKNYEEAANQMLLSLWSEQVGKRAFRLSEIMRLGKY